MVLFLHRVTDIDELPILEYQEIVLLGELLQTGDGFLAEVGQNVDMCFDDGNVGTKTCAARKGKISIDCFSREEVKVNCDCNRDVRSARSRSSFVVVTSAETVTLVFFASAISKSLLTRALGCFCARTP